MDRALFIGFFLGVILASPLGPMGLICLRRTLTQGPTSGFTSALGISCADTVWSFIIIHGLTAVSLWIEQEKNILEIAITLFFILYGLYGIFKRPVTDTTVLKDRFRASGFLSTFLVVFINPATFISFLLLFTYFGITRRHYDVLNSIMIAASVFCGSIVFWFALTQFLHRIRKTISDSIYEKISHVSSYVILALGVIGLAFGLYDIFY